MDSQHRHELGENVLAHWLTDKIEAVKPHLPLIVLVLGAVLVGGIGVNLWSDSASSIEEVAWEGYSQAVNSGAPNLPVLEQVVQSNQGTSVVPWAGITWADGRLWEASQRMLRERDMAIAALDEAEAKYNEIIVGSAAPAELKNRARLGLGRAAELRGDVEAAIQAYGQVQGAFKELAEARAKELGEPEVQEAVVWLASAEASAMRAPFNPGAVTEPDATPDPLDLPSDSAPSNPASSADTFSDLLKSIEAGAASGEAQESAQESTDGEMTDSAEQESAPEENAAAENAAEEATKDETPAGDSEESAEESTDESSEDE